MKEKKRETQMQTTVSSHFFKSKVAEKCTVADEENGAKRSFEMEETPALQVGEPIRMGDIDKEEAPWSDPLRCVAWGKTESTEVGWS